MTFVSFAQNFEDVVLWRALKEVEHGAYLDIGAQDPNIDSVSLAFYQLGWRGTHVEPTPTYANRLRDARPDETVIEAAVSCAPGPIEFYEFPTTGLSTAQVEIADFHEKNGFDRRKIIVPTVRLDALFSRMQSPLHWLKIDVEGSEADVLESWGENDSRPWIVVIEATYPTTQEPTHFGWVTKLLARGYREVYYDGLSRIYLHSSQEGLADRFESPPNVFDGFAVSASHFTAAVLNQQRSEQTDQEAAARNELELSLGRDREQQLSALQARLEAEVASRQADQDRTSEALRESEARYGEAHASLKEAAHTIEELRIRENVALEESLEAQRSHSSYIERLHAERLIIEGELRAEISQIRDGKEKALVRISALDRDVEHLHQQVQERQRETAAAEARVAQWQATAVMADRLIRQVRAQRPGWWMRLGHALHLSSLSPVTRLLSDWVLPEATVSADHQSTPKCPSIAMADLVSSRTGNPYLRANCLSELLAWPDVNFVRCAYVTVLGRQPDPEGEAYYTDRLRRGFSKLEILWNLRRSPEGPSHDPGIAGFDRALRRAAWARRAILGWPIRLRYAEEGNDAAWRRHRVVSNQIDRVIDRLASQEVIPSTPFTDRTESHPVQPIQPDEKKIEHDQTRVRRIAQIIIDTQEKY